MNAQEAEQEAIRAHLRVQGFQFCDETSLPDWHENEVRKLARHQQRHSQQGAITYIVEAGVSSSTCDHDLQAIGNTLGNDEEFWSSTGSEEADCNETLLYRLRHPLCRVFTVQLAVYRARYQFGSPVYPPRGISFAIGPSPRQLQKLPGLYPVRAHDELQLFPLPAEAPLGRYLEITFHGKQQRQLQDFNYYIAIRRVLILGHAMPFSVLRTGAQLPSRTLASLENGVCLNGNSEHLVSRGSRRRLPAGQSRMDDWGDEYPTTQYALQGVGLVAMSHTERSRETTIFVWHDGDKADADAVD